MMLSLTLLPARQGDAIWLRWGNPDQPLQLLIDMGTEEVGKDIRSRLLDLPEEKRRFELLVVTHVDRDHIGGVLTCLAEADPIPGFVARDVWFNGYPHLEGHAVHTGLEPMGPAQGERLATWLKQQVWNGAYAGGPVQRVPGQSPPTVMLPEGLRLSVLGPTPERLAALNSPWKNSDSFGMKRSAVWFSSAEILGRRARCRWEAGKVASNLHCG